MWRLQCEDNTASFNAWITVTVLRKQKALPQQLFFCLFICFYFVEIFYSGANPIKVIEHQGGVSYMSFEKAWMLILMELSINYQGIDLAVLVKLAK